MTLHDKDEIAAYLQKHLYANLGTISAHDPTRPHVSTIAYVNDGVDLYFTTTIQTEKFANITKNPKVALTIDEDEPDWSRITGLQIEGKAEVVKDGEVPRLFEMLAEKFPAAKEVPPDPDYRFIKITPNKVWIIDYRKEFGHRDLVEA